jgi:sugar lactone lactonase YvrE
MLIVAETFAARLTAFHIDQDGALSHRRVWAQFDDLGIITQGAELRERIIPDGICLDAEDAIWVASPNNNAEVVRVCEGGKITHRIQFEKKPYACMLGGPDRKTLFVLTSNLGQNQGSGQIETVQVDIPGAGLP